ncbi:enoyl-CoA hydratase-related protein [Rhodococcus sp. (in: high G+C Gram-positive bacteria)]|uniref:enoyl-CoA hydratase-related protein n=1 Tax=Rhodococcus sp. TaxID=1831 RepID=UPI00257B9803|nr:enoyl-CoA hydratase-related protein [Rhodococcus sp. (in: high G+C Gram-positive bacteria)]MBQ9056438.1 enoyl-CoA hydratase/isomerase family protein [Rhodococcus sp. (in: high G+C Gram-positive bacteria)]
MTVFTDEPAPGIRVLTIDRPGKLNAFDSEAYVEMADAVIDAEQDVSVRAVVITGAGGVFTSGNDLQDFAEGPEAQEWLRMLQSISAADTPIIAAVEGFAIGIGTTLLLHCDLAYAGRSTMFAMPFVKLGLSPEGASSLLLPHVAGAKGASELLLLGEKFDTSDAQTFGLINRVVDDGAALTRAIAAAEAISKSPQDSVRLTKRLLRRNRTLVESVLIEEAELFVERRNSHESRALISRVISSKSAV